jgi:hypothetical protein
MADKAERTVSEYAWLCINARMCNARYSADPVDLGRVEARDLSTSAGDRR